jgi:hypothetical protein
MNVQVSPPIEASLVPLGDFEQLLSAAKLSDAAALLDALEARRCELGLSLEALEHLAGLTAGHATKVIGPARQKSPNLQTVDKLMAALGISVVLVIDPSKVGRIESQWERRNSSFVRARKLGKTTLERARPQILSELARAAGKARWRGKTPEERRAWMKKIRGKS